MLSPAVSVPTPEGANLHPTSSRRRALSYLRHLSHSSQNRSGSGSGSPTGAESPRTSPRSYFHRSTSYPDPRDRSSPSQPRRRSGSPPNERETTDRLVDEAVNRLNTSQADEGRTASPVAGETTNTDNEAPSPENNPVENETEDMVRATRSTSTRSGDDEQRSSLMDSATRPRATRTATNASTISNTDANGSHESKPRSAPAIRFFPHQEVRSNGRQSLNFVPVSRTLPEEGAIIRVGRYSEREGIPNPNPSGPSDAPVGFKSKVVSRKHCEFSFANGQWFIKDVQSSSGTFLNHIRLSAPNTESKLFPVKDGDIVQLGIDFRGGEEMIFRCVKIRIECNRSWQKKPNNFK
jgi:E3 ubiquitin-protein ligase DMA1/2